MVGVSAFWLKVLVCCTDANSTKERGSAFEAKGPVGGAFEAASTVATEAVDMFSCSVIALLET